MLGVVFTVFFLMHNPNTARTKGYLISLSYFVSGSTAQKLCRMQRHNINLKSNGLTPLDLNFSVVVAVGWKHYTFSYSVSFSSESRVCRVCVWLTVKLLLLLVLTHM